jgi:hypothetical protein
MGQKTYPYMFYCISLKGGASKPFTAAKANMARGKNGIIHAIKPHAKSAPALTLLML